MTIFSKILAGEIPCHTVYEDALVLAFLDIMPLSRGHTLVIPREPAPTLDQLSDDSAAALGRALPRICRAIVKATGTPDYNILQNNGEPAHQAVHHVHFHIIPKPTPTPTTSPSSPQGLGIVWPAGRLDHGEARTLAAEIAKAMK